MTRDIKEYKSYTQDEIDFMRQESYNKGLDEGRGEGYTNGYQSGYHDGWEIGFDSGSASE